MQINVVFLSFSKFHTGKVILNHMDDASKTCITAYPNLVTGSQKDTKSCDFCEKKSHTQSVVVCEEHCYVFVAFCQEFDKKAQDLKTYLPTEI